MPLKQANHTQISNDFLDNHISKLNGAAIRVFLIISRQTIGWHKPTDKISFTQIEQKTGLSRPGIDKAIKELEQHGLIVVDRSRRTNSYSINYASENGKLSLPEELTELTKDSKLSLLTKETIKETRSKKDILPSNGLHVAIREAFISKHGPFVNHGKEGVHINKMISLTNGNVPEIKAMMTTFFKLKSTEKSDWWKNAPFTPSVMISKWDWIKERIPKKLPEDLVAVVEGLFK